MNDNGTNAASHFLYDDPERPISDLLWEQCKLIKLVIFDVDGVFSDGSIYLGNNQEEFKAFNTKDGYGVKALSQIGIEVGVITGRRSNIVQNRMTSLQVKYILQGQEDKRSGMFKIIKQAGCAQQNIASMGDDIPDLGMFEYSGISVAPSDAHPLVKKEASLVTSLGGGLGAVREFCDLLLQVNNKLHDHHGASM
jgi:3-deoxy-D-manno-octulosonate 8-phosphate phosphatase (KDO 8-P phosphatase)